MDKLWAPWRRIYLTQKQPKGCFLCKILKSKQDTLHFVLKRTKHSFALLNLYPYNNGHVLIAPKRHVDSLEKLSDRELLDMMHLTNHSTARIRKRMKPHGFNLGVNLGRVSGAGLPGHVHLHIVPRWSGDTNFLPVFGETKVISDSLQATYKTLMK